jgi:hypothetical protein
MATRKLIKNNKKELPVLAECQFPQGGERGHPLPMKPLGAS